MLGWLANVVGVRAHRRPERVVRVVRGRYGEAFAVLTHNPRLPEPVRLDLLAVEADRVGTPLPIDNAVDGIVFDAAGNPVEYHVLRRHPGDGLTSADFDRVPAVAMLHWFRRDRPGQIRDAAEPFEPIELEAGPGDHARRLEDEPAASGAAEHRVQVGGRRRVGSGPRTRPRPGTGGTTATRSWPRSAGSGRGW